MAKVLKILGIIFLLLIVVGGLSIGYLFYKKSNYEKTAIPYIRSVFPIFATWEIEQVKMMLVPATIKATKEEDLKNTLNWFKKLGSYRSMDDPSCGHIFSGTNNELGAHTILTCSFNSTFENGNASVVLKLLMVPNGYQVFAFTVNSNALIEN